jgi:hypothetical protein
MRIKQVISTGMLIFRVVDRHGGTGTAIASRGYDLQRRRRPRDRRYGLGKVLEKQVEFIGCGVRRIYTINGDAVRCGFCEARTASSVIGTCFSEESFLLEALASINDYSFVTFAWNADGVCTAIGNSTQSIYIPDK